MGSFQEQELDQLINQLYSTRVGNTIYGPSIDAQWKVPKVLLSMTKRSAESRNRVIRALIDSLEESSEGEDTAFRIVSDLLGKLKAVEAIDTLVKYIDYQPNRIGASLNRCPAVKGLIQIGEAAVPRIGDALITGKSVLQEGEYLLRSNAVRALMYIGGRQAKDVLRSSYMQMEEEKIREEIMYAIEQIEKKEAEEQSDGPRVKFIETE